MLMPAMPPPLARVLAAVIVLAGVFFAAGVAIERSSHTESSAHSEGADTAGAEEAQAESAPTESESILGINPESPALIAVALVVSIALAVVALAFPGSRRLMLSAAAVLLTFVAIDILEVIHQVDASRAGVAMLAALVAVLHAGGAAVAFLLARASTTSGLEGRRPEPKAVV